MRLKFGPGNLKGLGLHEIATLLYTLTRVEVINHAYNHDACKESKRLTILVVVAPLPIWSGVPESNVLYICILWKGGMMIVRVWLGRHLDQPAVQAVNLHDGTLR